MGYLLSPGRKRLPLLFVLSFAGTVLLFCVLGVFLWMVLSGGLELLSWDFLFSPVGKSFAEGGLLFPLLGSLLLVALVAVIVLPCAVAVALFVHEYAKGKVVARVVRFMVSNLAGVPSIVFGLFALGFFVNILGKLVIDDFLLGGLSLWGRPNLLWAALTLVLLTFPFVMVAVEEALKSVPQELRDASLALGATRLQTVLVVVLPAAVPGILNGFVFAVSRTLGEVAPVMFVGVAVYLKQLPAALSDQFMHLGYHIYNLLVHAHDSDKAYPVACASVIVLMGLILFVNVLVLLLRRQCRS